MSRRTIVLVGCIALVALAWPAASPADHITTSATVSAAVKERRSTDWWAVEISWIATCNGAKPGTAWFDGALHLVDEDTGERIDAGGVPHTSGERTVSGQRTWFVSARKRPRRLKPELTIGCYENFPLHGGRDVTVSGNAVIIPPSFGRGGGGSGGGGRNGGGGGGDPTEPLVADGCVNAVLGTNLADRLTGSEGGDVIIGFGARDRLRGLSGHDCLIGGTGNDWLDGGLGDDRLTGGRGNDVLIDEHGVNAFDAGPGNDYVNARNGKREPVRCGPGRDRARVDRRDRVRGCERVSRPR